MLHLGGPTRSNPPNCNGFPSKTWDPPTLSTTKVALLEDSTFLTLNLPHFGVLFCPPCVKKQGDLVVQWVIIPMGYSHGFPWDHNHTPAWGPTPACDPQKGPHHLMGILWGLSSPSGCSFLALPPR